VKASFPVIPAENVQAGILIARKCDRAFVSDDKK
jgi:hypothetical protein